MKRKLLTMIISIAMVMSFTSAFTFAESETMHIETVAQLKKALGDNLSMSEKAALVENAKDEVVAEFMEEKMDKAAKLINGQNFSANMQTMPDGSAYGTQTFDLGDGCVMTVELSDCEQDQTNGMTQVMTRATAASNEQWKAYGSRSFTAKASVACIVGTAYMTLVNNYTLSSNGIDERPGSASCSVTSIKTLIDAGTPKITDSVARTPGASDVNMHCDYIIREKSAGSDTHKYRLSTTIGYVAINKTDKKIKVRESWSLSKVS
ncbi:hypothetical protein [Emergencia sp.]|uniref:hypothetical protein n=1 Tax=Emergencia sp. TaxID=1926557 RepID=UPI003AF1AD68